MMNYTLFRKSQKVFWTSKMKELFLVDVKAHKRNKGLKRFRATWTTFNQAKLGVSHVKVEFAYEEISSDIPRRLQRFIVCH